ncbi:MAG: c-type cytochrome domain-containing protein [Opitutales bacterium]
MDLLALFGRLHPVVLHLPIGAFATIALAECWLIWRKKQSGFGQLMVVLYIFGFVSCVLAIATGLSLQREDAYGGNTLDRHRLLGYITGIAILVTTALAFLSKSDAGSRIIVWSRRGALSVSLALITLAGHLGGEMTHGKDFLTEFAPSWIRGDEAEAVEVEMVAVTRETTVFEAAIKPAMDLHCTYCHDADNSKGGLRMDTIPLLLAGGSSGPLFVADEPHNSLMLQRMQLPLEDEEHMPPKTKRQPEQIHFDAFSWWIENGASTEQKLSDPSVPEFVRSLVPAADDIVDSDAPAVEFDAALLNSLREQFVTVQRLEQGSDKLWVDFSAVATTAGDALVEQLQPLAPHIVWLNLSRTQISDVSMETIGQMSQLVDLNLRATAISDEGLQQLSQLGNLKRINLTDTKISVASIGEFLDFAEGASIYLYNTEWGPEESAVLQTVRADLKVFNE